MSEPMKCGGWSFPTIGCGAELRAERYGRDPVVDHDTMIRCLDCGTPMCPRCAREHFRSHIMRVRDEAVHEVLWALEDEDHLQCEHMNRDEPCNVCVPCLARVQYQTACARLGKTSTKVLANAAKPLRPMTKETP